MNLRLKQFLLAENISQSQFAEKLGVAPASISHILGGRNKPGYDFLVSLARHYPSLNLEWLITGKGKMYNQVSKNSLFDSYNPLPEPENPPVSVELPQQENLQKVESRLNFEDVAAQERQESPKNADETEISAKNPRKITKVMVFYDDNTFEEVV